MKNILKLMLKQYFLPKWIVLLYDLAVMGTVFAFSTYLVANFSAEQAELQNAMHQVIASTFIFLIVYLIIKPHYNIIRHTTLKDFSSIVYALTFGSTGLLILATFGRINPLFAHYAIPYPVIIIQFFISAFILLTSRLFIKAVYHSLFLKPESVQNTMIFGAGRLGMIAHNVLERENQLSYNVVGFIDDNPNLHGKKINGVRVYSAFEAIEYVLTKKKVKEVIIAIAPWEISLDRKQQFVNACIEKELQIKEVADVSAWIKGSLEKVKIQNIKIEDLLGREPISIDINKISAGLNGKSILVTGAAGSIGSEIVRKLLLFNPAKVILVDQAESALYNFHNELLASIGNINVEIIVGNVSDLSRMRSIFEEYRPDIVFHASAYKHVPLMEKHPYEAVKTNIGGTKVMADLSVEFEVKKFVMISTDKAVNPTNVMGASKRICEIYIQSLSQLKGIKTQFVTTRFGNVLGSNGSVVPLFKSQIEKGGPVTITHKDITRYFMTIPEACQLVLEAGFMGNGSEIYVFDMGSPVKIYDLAEKMIFLSGYIPHKDIKIIVTGLRPGEKLYEELLSSKENCMPTHNEKITIGKIRQYDYYEANSKIIEMLDNLSSENDEIIVARMKDLVEEFISQNSKYEKLDNKVEELEYRRVS
ncbi:MAG: polysaccharide biosynthesis protein [Mariniphaga sp.]|nr:polysaccharide biosynthesis protein [Mariniphaga sp.]